MKTKLKDHKDMFYMPDIHEHRNKNLSTTNCHNKSVAYRNLNASISWLIYLNLKFIVNFLKKMSHFS